MDGPGFTKFVEEVGEADFDEDVVCFDVSLEVVLMFDDGVFKGDTVRTNEIGVDDEVIFSIHVANGGLFVPDFVGVIGGFRSHTDDNSSNNNCNDDNNTADSKNFFHFAPLFAWSRDIFHLLL